MKIHVYLLCYNEESIIKNTIDYYSTFCSKIFILDNMSTDSSVSIAKKYPKVTIISWQNNGYIDESLYVKLKSQTYKNYSREDGKFTTEVADWIISCDMDEILYHPDLVSVLKAYKEKGVTVPCITGFNMIGDNIINPELDIITQYSKAVRARPFDKRIVFDCNFDISYSYGCHPKGVGFEYMKNTYSYKSSNEFPLALLHYKHVGQRFYETGEKNSSRVNTDKLWVSEDNKLVGPGWQYVAIQSGQLKKLNEDVGHDLFDENYNIKFNNFPPCTGEKGLALTKDKSDTMSTSDIDFLRDLAIKLEGEKGKYRAERIRLMETSLVYRPNGEFIKNRLKKYLKE